MRSVSDIGVRVNEIGEIGVVRSGSEIGVRVKNPGKELENTWVVDFRSASRVFVNRQCFPLHPGVEHFEDGVKGFVITEPAVRTTLGQSQMR